MVILQYFIKFQKDTVFLKKECRHQIRYKYGGMSNEVHNI